MSEPQKLLYFLFAPSPKIVFISDYELSVHVVSSYLCVHISIRITHTHLSLMTFIYFNSHNQCQQKPNHFVSLATIYFWAIRLPCFISLSDNEQNGLIRSQIIYFS